MDDPVSRRLMQAADQHRDGTHLLLDRAVGGGTRPLSCSDVNRPVAPETVGRITGRAIPKSEITKAKVDGPWEV